MMEFDSFYIKFGGIADDGFHDARVIVGFWDDASKQRNDVEIPVRLEVDLDLSLRELRERAKVVALNRLREATQLLEQFSADQLHSKGQDALAESEKRSVAKFEADLRKNFDQGS